MYIIRLLSFLESSYFQVTLHVNRNCCRGKIKLLLFLLLLLLLLRHMFHGRCGDAETIVAPITSSGGNKQPQISRTLRRILADPSSTVFWSTTNSFPTLMSVRCSSSFFGTVPSAPITIGATFTLFVFHRFLISNARSRYLLTFSSCFGLNPPVIWTCNVNYKATFTQFVNKYYVRAVVIEFIFIIVFLLLLLLFFFF